jgi:predicted site-specific integrase-resolvase
VVTHRDRLCRFGFELIEGIVTDHSNGKIVVLDNKETSPQQELCDDLISIITVFSARLYGLRTYSVKKEIKKAISIPKQKKEIREDFSL